MSFRLSKIFSVSLLAAITIIFFYGSTTFIYILPALIFCLGVTTCAGVLWLVRRGVIKKSSLPKTGLEFPLLLFLTGALVSMVFSPGPRIGLERMAWFVAVCLLFFVLVDLFTQPYVRSIARIVLLLATLPLLFHALSETYVRYLIWWDQAGSRNAVPPFPMRFSSLLGHSNIFMALTNLIAPLAVVLFFKAGSRAMRILCAFWLVMYAAAVPFSSSRGGWMGTAVWIGALSVWFIVEKGRWKKAIAFFQFRPAIALSGGFLFITILAAGGITFYNQFAGAHPSHGSALSLNREHIWGGALQIWQASPWTGSGLGRLGLEYLTAARTFPSGWWPLHAHSVPLQVLSETGLVGFVPFVALSIVTALVLARSYRSAPAKERPWMAASLAALASVLFHGAFEDLTSPFTVLFAIAFEVALLLNTGGQVTRFQRISLSWLAVPGAAVLAVAVFNLWSRMPLYQASEKFDDQDWRTAGRAAEESLRRDPLMPFFSAQAGMAYAMIWQQTANPEDLQSARNYLLQAAALEPNSSLLWANLAVLNWYDGHTDEAIEMIQKAIALCPREPSFYINYGWFLENSRQHEQAQAQYRLALEQDPRINSHPFWTASTDRRTAASEYASNTSPTLYHWEQAKMHLESGDANQARFELAISSQYLEPAIPQTVIRAKLLSMEGDPGAARQAYSSLANLVQGEYSNIGTGPGLYGWYFYRSGFPISLVPGYMRVSEDAGQFNALEEFAQMQISEGDYSAAAITQEIFQRAVQGGELAEANLSSTSSLQH